MKHCCECGQLIKEKKCKEVVPELVIPDISKEPDVVPVEFDGGIRFAMGDWHRFLKLISKNDTLSKIKKSGKKKCTSSLYELFKQIHSISDVPMKIFVKDFDEAFDKSDVITVGDVDDYIVELRSNYPEFEKIKRKKMVV